MMALLEGIATTDPLSTKELATNKHTDTSQNFSKIYPVGMVGL